MIWNKKTTYYCILVTLFLMLKFFFREADNSELAFLLKPTSLLVNLLIGSSSTFILEQGFFHEDLNIVIDKSCSGFNFWMLCFSLFSFTLLQSKKIDFRFFFFPPILVFTYLLTIFTNTSRILIAYKMNFFLLFINKDNHHLTHEAIGSFVFVFFFTFFYLLLHFFLTKDTYEKPSQS
jgi:exosortase K